MAMGNDGERLRAAAVPGGGGETTATPTTAAIARTAYYCCGVRAADACSSDPVCGDVLAKRFMDHVASDVYRRFERFAPANAANAARHRIIDDLLRSRIAADPRTAIVLVGAGFDTRAFRLPGGHWLEIDQAALLARKEAVLPAGSAPNPLVRHAVDFATVDLAAVIRGAGVAPPAVVVLEGVSMYLGAAALATTLAALRRALPVHTLVVDLMTALFARRYGRGLRQAIRSLGGDYGELADDPVGRVAAAGYRWSTGYSIAGRAVDHGSVRMPRWLLSTVLASLRDGYRVHVFETRG